jgi:flagellar basal body rod protein FlgG
MIYGMYLSAAGMVNSSYRQDLIANNIANSETVGFKRDLALVQERLPQSDEVGLDQQTGDDLLNQIGGGLFASPTQVDSSQGDLSPTGNNLDVALQGPGYYGVKEGGQIHLTRNGQFIVDSTGRLVMATNPGQSVLDNNQNPIQLKNLLPVSIDSQGAITQDGKEVGRIGVFNVADAGKLTQEGGTLLGFPEKTTLIDGSASLRSGFVERSNVEAATELTKLMETQRQLEANANMIKYQDATLDKLINDAGKIS